MQTNEREFGDECRHRRERCPVRGDEIESGDDEQSEADLSHANEYGGADHEWAALGGWQFGGGAGEEEVGEAGTNGHREADEVNDEEDVVHGRGGWG